MNARQRRSFARRLYARDGRMFHPQRAMLPAFWWSCPDGRDNEYDRLVLAERHRLLGQVSSDAVWAALHRRAVILLQRAGQ